jgi:hypothetical protein
VSVKVFLFLGAKMSRIRTIKPQFFRNLKLYHAEVESCLPLRIAFAGLWTACDREGRFKWIPEELKLDVMPFDEVDFSRVLDALFTRGYLVKYRVRDAWFGAIPSWKHHQVVNNRETASEIPDVSVAEEIADASVTREPRDVEIEKRKGKGNMEGERNSEREHAREIAVVRPEPDSLFIRLRNFFQDKNPTGFRDPSKEIEAISWLIGSAQKAAPGDAEGYLSAIIKMFIHKRENGDRFEKGRLFLPSVVESRWDYLVRDCELQAGTTADLADAEWLKGV